MSKRLDRWLKAVVIGGVVCLVGIDTSLACRWRTRQAVGCYIPAATCGCDEPSVQQPPLAESPSNEPPVPEAALDEPAAEPAQPQQPVQPESFDDLYPPAAPKPVEPAPQPAPPAAEPAATPPVAPAELPEKAPEEAPEQTPAKVPAKAPALPPVDDDPFAPVTPPAPPAAPAAKPAADPAADPFKISAAGELPTRQWTDDTGLFHVRGQLLAVAEGKVRILKASGRTTTVPLTRLSAADRAYVQEAASLHGDTLSEKLAAR